MMKNSNKKAGDWGALKNKPQNQIYFKDGGKVKVTAGGEKHVIYKKTTKRGEGKVGDIMVNHPTKDKGVWDTIDLTKKSGAKTIKQGIASTKKWHKENPYNDMKKQVTKKQNGGIIANARKKSLINRYNKASDRAKDAQARALNAEDYFQNSDTNYDGDNQIQGANPVTYTAGRKRQNAKINNAQARVGKNAERETQIYKNVDTAERAYKNNRSDENAANWDTAIDDMNWDNSREDTDRTLSKIRGVENRVERKVNHKWGKNERRVEKIGKKLDKMGPKKTTVEMKRGGSVKKYQKGGTPPKVKTRTVTTNPGGYSKTIVKTKTVNTPGKQGTVSTTKTIPTIKGVASDYASGVRKSVYGFKEAVDNKRALIKKRRDEKMEIPNKINSLRQDRKAARPILNSTKGGAMKKGGTVKKYQAGGYTSEGIGRARIGVFKEAYDQEMKDMTKNKINALGRNVRKTKATNYKVPAKFVSFADTDSPEMRRLKEAYLADTSGRKKTGTQKTRSVTNLKKGTEKVVTRSTGSYRKDGEKRRTVTKTSLGSKMQKGGTIKKKK